jgi:FKBP-type peptidyl-prolyl cis-trans isomerase FkpA
MKSIQSVILFVVAAVMFTACNKVSNKKTPGGMEYKLYRGSGKTPIQAGNTIKVRVIQQIKDSVYFTSEGKLPVYIPITDRSAPYDISELWLKLRKGDSVIATQLMDTFIKRNPTQVPPEFKNGDKIITTLKILDIFTSDSLAKADESKEKDNWLKAEIAAVQKYLDDKKITAQKTPSGAFIQITKPGEGAVADSGKFVSLMYKGTSFSGKVFDTNLDSSFHHTEPLEFQVGVTPMIKGFDEGVRFLNPGAEATIYVPSMLAYGPTPQSPDIKPFEHLIFELRVLSVKDQVAPPPPPVQRPKIDAAQPQR